jgi:hypothetical protein
VIHTPQEQHQYVGVCAGRKVVSADTRIVKVWGATDGAPYTSIEPPGAGDINDVCVWPNSGCTPQGSGGLGTITEGWHVCGYKLVTCSVHMLELVRAGLSRERPPYVR